MATELSQERLPRQLGLRIREARRHSATTVGVLAEKSGVHSNTISAIENGKSNPTRPTLERIAKALGLTFDALVGTAPPTPLDDNQVTRFLDDYRRRNTARFEDWSDAMWQRYVQLGHRMGITNDGAALFFADRVYQEQLYIRQFQELIDANQEAPVVAALCRAYEQLRPAADSQRAATYQVISGRTSGYRLHAQDLVKG